MSIKVGTVFSYQDLPDVSNYPFIINKQQNKQIFVRKGLFVFTESKEGFLIGIVERILLLNEYFSDGLTIKAYDENTNLNIIKGLFPSDDFEFAIAIVKCLGIIKFNEDNTEQVEAISRMTYPANPGSSVYLVDESILNQFIGFDTEQGLLLGNVKVTEFKALVNMDRLLNKHLAILSISGGGKSYLTSVLIEELLARETGTPVVVLIDVHGEYLYLQNISQLKEKIQVYDTTYFQISTSKLSPWSFKKYEQQISPVQIRELSKYVQELKNKEETNGKYSISDLISHIEEDPDTNKSTKQALVGWLTELDRLHLFGATENPNIKNAINEGRMLIFSLEKEINIKKKQIIVDYLCNRLFYLRRMDSIPPFFLIVEEAHQFCPEAAQSKAISKSIIETISREGRKFMACLCLISQRPKKLSTTALSQMNSKMILNIKNPYDLKHLMDSSESITKRYADMISTLGVGEMLLMGNAINYPVFIDVRKRKFQSKSEDVSLTDVCLSWQKKESE
ncbi:MAG: AAA-like domain protein [Promethearchaeota archaeon]|nr:MAG: AAA-like domain protein [Candidatus Lokiarchaeota archaeon]